MDITLSPDLGERITEKVRGGEFESTEALVRQALDWFLHLDDEDLEETRAAITEAREQSRRGEAVPAEQVFEELRAKYGLPR